MRNPVFTDVLENEIKILSTLSHKNSLYSYENQIKILIYLYLVVTYYGSAIDRSKKQPVFQIIMEYVDGLVEREKY